MLSPMARVKRACGTAMAAGFLLALSTLNASAQLSRTDIDTLRARGASEGWTFTVGENAATTRPFESLCGMVVPENWQKLGHAQPAPASQSLTALPSSYDWRALNGCTSIKDQGNCGACWAFGTVGALECAIKIHDKVDVDLSEQWLVNCNQDGWGCGGGWWAHDYHLATQDHCGGSGAVMESDLPYVARDGACSCPYVHHYWINSWSYIDTDSNVPTVDKIKQAIIDHGPVSVAIHVGGAFQAYTGGVFNTNEVGQINHAVVLVGWNDADGAWILRNSWSPGWGENGYMRIKYGVCQVGYAACWVDYKGSTPPPPTGVDLAVSQSASPTSVAAGANATFTVTVRNSGGTPATSVMVTDTLAPGLQFVSVNPAASSTVDGTNITTQLGSIGVGETKTITIVAKAVSGGALQSTAVATSAEPDANGSNNIAVASVTVDGADLTGSWSAVSQSCRTLGGKQYCTLKGTLTVQNIGTRKSSTCSVDLVLSSDPVRDAADKSLGKRMVTVLQPGKTSKIVLTSALPVNTSASGKYLIAVIDPTGTAAETNEQNNTIVYGPLP